MKVFNIICMSVLIIFSAYAQSAGLSIDKARLAPHLLNYQGYLTDSLGVPVTDTLDMTFEIYLSETGGTPIWSDIQSVDVERGVFSVILDCPYNVFTGDVRYLQLTVAAQTLSPRTRITATGYAYTATHSDTAEYAKNAAADNDWTISGNNMYSAVPGSVGVGVTSPVEKLDVNGAVNVSSSYNIGGNRVLSNAGANNIFVGVGAGDNNTGTHNTFLGDSAGSSNTSGYSNTFTGMYAGNYNKDGFYNTFTGAAAGIYHDSGSYNTFTGTQAGFSNDGNRNTFTGFGAGVVGITGNDNTFTGYYAGYWNSGDYNTFIGAQAGCNHTAGDSSVFIGYRAGYSESGSNKLYIANGEDDANVLIYGEFDNLRVGIATTSPGSELSVNGGASIGSSYAGSAAPNNGMIIEGNAGIGTNTPARKLHVNDVMRLEPTSAPASPAEGDLYMDATTHKLRVYDGTQWQDCW